MTRADVQCQADADRKADHACTSVACGLYDCSLGAVSYTYSMQLFAAISLL